MSGILRKKKKVNVFFRGKNLVILFVFNCEMMKIIVNFSSSQDVTRAHLPMDVTQSTSL